MTASMLHGNADVVGNITSGGTESILCAVKAYRDYARHLHSHITHPEMVSIKKDFVYMWHVLYLYLRSCLCFCSVLPVYFL